MNKIRQYLMIILLGLIFFPVVSMMYANDMQKDENKSYPKYSWSFSGLFGGYDLSSVQRGFLVYQKACASCHGVQYMRYADLQQAGLNLEQIEKIATMNQVLDGKNMQGQDNYRPATVKDFLDSHYVNEAVAKTANAGRIPLDLSRYASTNSGQADYIMAILLGYSEPPTCFHLDQDGLYYNKYFPGHQIAMKSPLIKDGVNYIDGTSATIEQQAKDVATFLSWTAHPHLIERHRIGIMVVLYVSFIAILTLLVKRKVWSNVK